MTTLKHQEPKVPLRERLALTDQMLNTFREAAKERNARSNWIPGPGEPTAQELAWNNFERGIMVDAVNFERSARNLPPVSVRNFMIVERLAVGHSDYATKLALYCAELAVGEITFEGEPAPILSGSPQTPRRNVR